MVLEEACISSYLNPDHKKTLRPRTKNWYRGVMKEGLRRELWKELCGFGTFARTDTTDFFGLSETKGLFECGLGDTLEDKSLDDVRIDATDDAVLDEEHAIARCCKDLGRALVRGEVHPTFLRPLGVVRENLLHARVAIQGVQIDALVDVGDVLSLGGNEQSSHEHAVIRIGSTRHRIPGHSEVLERREVHRPEALGEQVTGVSVRDDQETSARMSQ